MLGGPPPIGFKITGTYNKAKNVIEIIAYDGNEKGPLGTLVFDEKSNTLVENPSGNSPYHRRFNEIPDDAKSTLLRLRD
ncbi:hypothetical protein [Solimicrobium silvestre]|uniref:Uncharacterized protein n=1 Tax=Solimicrobium silvestre TaxID=2099400 RepID=A0A2S9H460_9BURK|nr:hypothetical protein [Solimicrobium silvestre]PRC94741.1 hypothetical protein S2091_0744 [Solimicrobium silvestre]